MVVEWSRGLVLEDRWWAVVSVRSMWSSGDELLGCGKPVATGLLITARLLAVGHWLLLSECYSLSSSFLHPKSILFSLRFLVGLECL